MYTVLLSRENLLRLVKQGYGGNMRDRTKTGQQKTDLTQINDLIQNSNDLEDGEEVQT